MSKLHPLPHGVLTPVVFSAICTYMSVYVAFYSPRADQMNMAKHLCEILHFVPNDCKAQNYNYKEIAVVISLEDKTYCFRHGVCIISVCGLMFF